MPPSPMGNFPAVWIKRCGEVNLPDVGPYYKHGFINLRIQVQVWYTSYISRGASPDRIDTRASYFRPKKGFGAAQIRCAQSALFRASPKLGTRAASDSLQGRAILSSQD